MSVRTATPDETDVERTILSLLASRRPGATLCPSDVARHLVSAGQENWRRFMPAVHAAAARLNRLGRVEIRQQGRPVDPDQRKGAYRITLSRNA